MVPPCYWGMQLEIARRLVMVGSRWQWVASGGAVLLGNATTDCWTPYTGGLKVAVGCERRRVIEERNNRLLDTLKWWA